MRAIEFPEVNEVYAKDQPQYNPLPVFKKPNDKQGLVVSKWTFTPEEFKQLFEKGAFYLSMLTFNEPLQPVLLSIDFPEKDDPMQYESQSFGKIVSQLIELRKEQIAKGHSIEEDIQLNSGGQLTYVAGFLCHAGTDGFPEDQLRQYCPPNWNIGNFIKYCKLPHKQRLILAAAFIVAELDRMDSIERKEVLDVK